MLRFLALFLLAAGTAAAAESTTIDRALQGLAGTAVSAEFAREFAPLRPDLTRHAVAGGAISTLVDSFAGDGAGWKAGLVVGAGKELVNDALLGRGHAQLDDFVVTASAALFSSRFASRFAPLVYLDGSGAELQFRYAF